MNTRTKIVFIEKEGRKSHLANLKQLLSEKFIIPYFQRPYAWDDDHFKDLIDSIKENKNNNNREAFLGSIIVALKKDGEVDEPGKQKYLLIDGQQRITSFLLLIKLIDNRLKRHIIDKDKKISEIETQLDKAKRDKDVNLVQKYAEQRKDENVRKTEIKNHLETIKGILTRNGTQKRIGRESHNLDELERNILKYIFSDQIDLDNMDIRKIKKVFDQEIADEDINIIDFFDYILDKCIFCFLTIKGEDSEDYAIDIFNSLNSTGEPLTAFEILKSLVHKQFQNNQDLQKQLTGKFNKIETELNRKKIKKVAQNKYTDRLLLFINMMVKDLQLQRTSTFRDKKKILDKILELQNDQIEQCVNTMYTLHKFILDNWENKTDPLKENENLTSQDKIIFDFFQSDTHDRVLPVLYYFKDNNNNNLSSAIRICGAFTCLWRGYSSDGSTDRIDSQYEKVIKNLFNAKGNIQSLRNDVIDILKKREKNITLKQKEWINKFKTIDIYKKRKLARFLLYVAFDKRDFNTTTKCLNEAKLRFLETTDEWHSEKYETIEHITPKDYQVIDKIGNLILLPRDINSKVGTENFIEKKKIYQECLETEPNEMPYIPVLKEIISYGEKKELDSNFYLNEKTIDVRGERLGNSIWQTLAEDWLGWKD